MIHIVIVESHQHVLEHIHDSLRKKKMFNEPWSMIHVDAHPDMACTRSAPATACFTPRCSFGNEMNLYEILDLSPSGIAEWILPLVLAANLNKIEWIKPKFSLQFAEGRYQFTVGVECHQNNAKEIKSFLDLSQKAQLKVDLNHPYYLDDMSVVSSDKLTLKQGLELQVSTASSNIDFESKWILDICLDYFACQNPYIHDIEKISPSGTRAFLDVMMGSKFNIARANNQPVSWDLDYQTEIVRFYELLEQLLLDNCEKNNRMQQPNHRIGSIIFGQISAFYETSEQAEKLILKLINEINNDSRLLSMVIEAIPNWSMPHDIPSWNVENTKKSLLLFEEYLQRRVKASNEPFLITIARSSLDGFCPLSVVDQLEAQVLDILDRTISTEISVVRDYGKWEGSTIP